MIGVVGTDRVPHRASGPYSILDGSEPGYLRLDCQIQRASVEDRWYDNAQMLLGQSGVLSWSSLRTRLLTEASWSGPTEDDVEVLRQAMWSILGQTDEPPRLSGVIYQLLSMHLMSWTPAQMSRRTGILIWSSQYSKYLLPRCRGFTSKRFDAGQFSRSEAAAIHRASDPWLRLLTAEWSDM